MVKELRDWHIATFQTQAMKGRYWTNNGQVTTRGLNKYAVNDPNLPWTYLQLALCKLSCCRLCRGSGGLARSETADGPLW